MSESFQTNGQSEGGKYIDSFDCDDPEYVRQLMRPVEVKEDVRQMEERKRVKLILQSRSFRDELEELVIEHMQSGGGKLIPGSLSLQQLSDLLLPKAKTLNVGNGVGPCIPIADLKDTGAIEFDKGEKPFRCKLASLYRLVDVFGWSHGIQSYITGRINQDYEHFLIAPYGIMHHEVTASNLVKVDMRGEVLDPGSTNLGINKIGFSLHSAIYASRPDIKCIVHIRCTPAVSVSALNCGLIPLCPEAMSVGDASYYVYSGGILNLEHRDKIRRALGPKNKVLVLRNFGIIVVGETVEETFSLVQNVMAGVDVQLQSIKSGSVNLQQPSDEEKRRAVEAANQVVTDEDGKIWKKGEQEFETLMKHLDNAGYRSGYPYREASVTQKEQKGGRQDSSVIVPPASSSFVYTFDDHTTQIGSPLKTKGPSKQKEFKSDWLTTGKKEELDETITSNLDTTKASKWAPEDTSTPIKPEHATRPDSRRDVQAKQPIENLLEESTVAHGGSGEPHATQVPQPKKEAETVNKPPPQLDSPVKSTSSAEGVLDDREGSPTKDVDSSPSKDKKKKKGGFRMPSFGGKKKEK
jgi:adducin